MPRIPKFKGSKKANSAAQQEPTTPDEFLEAGVLHEEAAEKWRASDAAKAVRFYQRALDMYARGLQIAIPPGSTLAERFNLEYNCARVLYTITQFPRLSREYSTEPLSHQLALALKAHRTASMTARSMFDAVTAGQQSEQTEAAYADILYNESQVLCSLAEAAQDEDLAASRVDVTSLTSEAIDKFEKCLQVQEGRYEKWRIMVAGNRAAGPDGALWFIRWQAANTDASPEQDQLQATEGAKESHIEVDKAGSATPLGQDTAHREAVPTPDEQDHGGRDTELVSVMETVTLTTLVETWLELLRALTLYCESLPTKEAASRDVAGDVAKFADDKGRYLLALLLDDAPASDKQGATEWLEDRGHLLVDTSIVTVKLVAAVSGEVRYRSQLISAPDFAAAVERAAEQVTWSHLLREEQAWIATWALTKAEMLCARAESLTDCASTIQELEPGQQSSTRWNALSKALELLAQATKIAGVDKGFLARIHQSRGDVEMARLTAISPTVNADKTKQTLLCNAGVYYRGAIATARAAIASSFNQVRHPDQEIVQSSSVRQAVAAALTAGSDAPLRELSTTLNEQAIQRELERMVADDAVQTLWLAEIGLSM